MANLNKVFLMGNLTRDPELRYTPSGMAVASFGMAMNRKWKSQDGQQKEDVCFVDVEAWARTAEVISEYCKKGSPLFVEGRLRLNTWEGRDGQKRSKLRVVVDNFQFIGAPAGRRGPDADSQADGAPAGRRGPDADSQADGAPPAPPPDRRQARPPRAEPPAEGQAPSQDNAQAEGQYQVDDDIPF